MIKIPSPLKAAGFVTNSAYGLTITGLFMVAVHGFGSYGLRQSAPSPQTKDIKAGVLVLFTKEDGEQIVLSNGPLPVGDGISENAIVHDQYTTINELEAASRIIIEENDSIGFASVQVREKDIIDGDGISPSFAAVPQICEDHDHCRVAPTAPLGNSLLAYSAKSELGRAFTQYRYLQAEYVQPSSAAGLATRKLGKEIYSIPVVQKVSDFIYSIRFEQ